MGTRFTRRRFLTALSAGAAYLALTNTVGCKQFGRTSKVRYLDIPRISFLRTPKVGVALGKGGVGPHEGYHGRNDQEDATGGLLLGEVLEGTYNLLHRPLSPYAHSAHYAPAGPKNRRLLLTRVRRRGVLGGPDATSCIILAHRAGFTYMLQPAAFYSRRHIVPFL